MPETTVQATVAGRSVALFAPEPDGSVAQRVRRLFAPAPQAAAGISLPAELRELVFSYLSTADCLELSAVSQHGKREFGALRAAVSSMRGIDAVRLVTGKYETEDTWRDVIHFFAPRLTDAWRDSKRMSALLHAFRMFDAAYPRVPHGAFYEAFHLILRLPVDCHLKLIKQIIPRALAVDAAWAREILVQYACRATSGFEMMRIGNSWSAVSDALLEAALSMWRDPATREYAVLPLVYIAQHSCFEETGRKRWASMLQTLPPCPSPTLPPLIEIMESRGHCLLPFEGSDRRSPSSLDQAELTQPGEISAHASENLRLRNRKSQIHAADRARGERWLASLPVRAPYVPPPAEPWSFGGAGAGC